LVVSALDIEAGIPKRTLTNARHGLGIRREKLAFGGGWLWRRPEGADVTEQAEEANPSEEASGGFLGEEATRDSYTSQEAPSAPSASSWPLGDRRNGCDVAEDRPE
jgi:hypothetical protein